MIFPLSVLAWFLSLSVHAEVPQFHLPHLMNDKPAYFDRARAATLKIYTQKGMGSGVVISDHGDGYLLTARHVIEDVSDESIFVPELGSGASVNVIYKRDDIDAALLRINLPSGSPLKGKLVCVPTSDRVPGGTDRLWTLGYPADLDNGDRTVSSGIHKYVFVSQVLIGKEALFTVLPMIRALRDSSVDYLGSPTFFGRSVFLATAPNHGMSGGPMINAQGELVAITNLEVSISGDYQLADKVGVGLRVSAIRDLFIGNNKIELAQFTCGEPHRPAQFNPFFPSDTTLLPSVLARAEGRILAPKFEPIWAKWRKDWIRDFSASISKIIQPKGDSAALTRVLNTHFEKVLASQSAEQFLSAAVARTMKDGWWSDPGEVIAPMVQLILKDMITDYMKYELLHACIELKETIPPDSIKRKLIIQALDQQTEAYLAALPDL